MSTPTNPLAAADPTQGLMQQAQSSMSNPLAQAVPQQGGVIDPSQHAALARIISILASAAQSYGWTAQPPQERLERQQMEAQKAEAMARISQGQQQIGIEQGRLGVEKERAGYEGERTKTEAKRAEQEAKYQTGMLGEQQKRTGIEAARQKAEQEYQTGGLAQQAKQLEETIAQHHAQNTLEGQRNNISAQANKIAADRVDMEEKHFDQQMQMQGLGFNRQVAEDERKALHTSLDEFYKTHSYTGFFTGKDSILQQHQAIDKYMDDKLSQAVPSGIPKQGGWGGWKPSQGVTAQPQSGGQRQPVYKDGKQIGWTTDGRTMTP